MSELTKLLRYDADDQDALFAGQSIERMNAYLLRDAADTIEALSSKNEEQELVIRELVEALRLTLVFATIKWGNLNDGANEAFDQARAAIAKV